MSLKPSIDIKSKSFKLLLKDNLRHKLTVKECAERLGINMPLFRYYKKKALGKGNKKTLRPSEHLIISNNGEVMTLDLIERKINKILECQRRRKVQGCEYCLWGKDCPNLKVR